MELQRGFPDEGIKGLDVRGIGILVNSLNDHRRGSRQDGSVRRGDHGRGS